MAINWYPGHMKKAQDEIRKKLGLVDLCCEVRDARIPAASENRELTMLTAKKKRLIILNKKDMADEIQTEAWLHSLENQGTAVLPLDATKEHPAHRVYQAARHLLEDTFQKRMEKGIQNPEIRMLVYGIPNSGKSTFINTVARKRTAKVGDRPGITTSQQWIHTDEKLLLMDTPGILPKRLEEKQALHLAWTGAIRDDILPLQDIGYALLEALIQYAPNQLSERYHVAVEGTALSLMEEIAKKTGALQKKGVVDYTRVARILLDDFRKQRFGRLTLESPKGDR